MIIIVIEIFIVIVIMIELVVDIVICIVRASCKVWLVRVLLFCLLCT